MVAEPLHRERRAPSDPPDAGSPDAGSRDAGLPDTGLPDTLPPGEELCAGPAIRPAQAPWALMYHSVDEYTEDPYRVTVTPARFARQMAWLHSCGLRGVGLGELLRAQAAGRAGDLVGLTFDDGYADLTRGVLPVLQQYGFSATAFVVVGRLGGHNVWDEGPRKPLLTADQIFRLHDCGVEIGSHGMYHRSLPGIAAETLAEETGRSRELLRDLLGEPVGGFCYPYGAVDAAAAAAVRDSGYDYGAAIAHGPLTGRWALPRSYVGERDNGLRLRAKRARHRLRGLRVGLDGEGAR
ncbi:polysaccharide deacetylase family protein [Streptacidiphilus carbonis]|uniref:polysaccharide deacetylase family protein n=1 Tax=Streptacidiphilus carbonis TaxID=105422 RepID=UPI000A019D9B|nr:polysaccharide deacetylase family protein [Streptacidiphilus carbonis]